MDANNWRPNPSAGEPNMDTALTGQANGGDWQEEVYQKIKTMKEMYLPELNEMYQKIAAKLQQHDSLPQQPKPDQLEKLKIFKAMLERIICFLQAQEACFFTATARTATPIAYAFRAAATSQISQGQPHDNQLISLMQSMNVQGPMATVQPNNVTSGRGFDGC